MRAGLLVSALLHGLVAIFLSGQFYIGSRTFSAVRLPPRPVVGLQVIDIRDVDAESAAEEVMELPPEERDEIQRPEPPTPGEGPRARDQGAESGPGMTNAERLQPREGDPRLWKDFSDRPLPEYLEDRFAEAEGVIRARLSAILDSLQLSEEQRRRAVEWLFGEGDQQWGVTPDGLVLGGMVIPMNVGALFQAEGPLGRELRQQARDRADIDRQEFVTDIERSQQERLEEMRRRSEEEAERRRQDSLAAEADTTDSGGSTPRD
ncbi:MAG: hypothetical protein M8866_09880 [marine benthic group bacterium]|nr:hypothetical protein [Candidatus Benthicola marisminoris]